MNGALISTAMMPNSLREIANDLYRVTNRICGHRPEPAQALGQAGNSTPQGNPSVTHILVATPKALESLRNQIASDLKRLNEFA